MGNLPHSIQKRGSRYAIYLPRGYGKRYQGQYDTVEDAVAARDAAMRRLAPQPKIEGLTNEDEEYAPDELWQAAFKAQLRTTQVAEKRGRRKITIPQPKRPFALAFLSDLHLGNASTDYQTLKHDVDLIAETPRMWSGFHGDGIDNWIVGKLAGLQRGQPIPFDAEVQLLTTVLETLEGKLLWVVAGNHDNWTVKLAGIDRIKEALRGTRVLYDRYEVAFDLMYGERSIAFKVRHQWKYSSIFNATHGIEVGWQRGDTDFDIGLGGHTHIGTLCRPFIRHGRRRYAILTGTYKVDGDYGRELGLPTPTGRGSGAMVFWPDGRRLFCESVQTAADFLRYLLARKNT